MKTTQLVIKNGDLNSKTLSELNVNNPQLGFIFSDVATFMNQDFQSKLKASCPQTQWVGCSTAGEVSKSGVTENTTVLSVLAFENPDSKFKISTCKIGDAEDSLNAGIELAKSLQSTDLKSVMVFSPGVNVNGSLLVQGLVSVLGEKVTITGGLAGDGGLFKNTLTMSPTGIANNQVVGIGFYGDGIMFSHGCMGGWNAFGKTRKVTKSKFNVLYELDGKPALDIYKEYLGSHSKDLPASGLMFPFSLLKEDNAESGLIRTILGVSEAEGSLTLAGNLNQDTSVRLMQATTDNLVQGAKTAAENAKNTKSDKNSFAMVVSCVGRKLVMGTNVDEEIEAVAEVFGANCMVGGFYSYGEISPFSGGGSELHNQTMTISYISEK